MIYICEECMYLFHSTELNEQSGGKYRCPDCGKFAVRSANEEEQKEYFERFGNKDEE